MYLFHALVFSFYDFNAKGRFIKGRLRLIVAQLFANKKVLEVSFKDFFLLTSEICGGRTHDLRYHKPSL